MMDKKLLKPLIMGVFIACIMGSTFCRANEEPEEEQGMSLISGIANRLKDGGGNSPIPVADRKQILFNIDRAFSIVQAEEVAITNANVKDILTCLDWLSSADFGNRTARSITIQQMTLFCLAKIEALDIELGFRLIGHLQVGSMQNIHKRGPASEKDWRTLRSQVVKYRLQLWKRINEVIDPNWDPTDVPILNVSPPVGQSGASPGSIADPELRAEYEASIEANRKKTEHYSQQFDARQLRDRYALLLKGAIADAYRMGPVTQEDFDTLQKYLQTYVSDEDFRQKLFEASQTASQDKRR